jgi:hypothetical protein
MNFRPHDVRIPARIRWCRHPLDHGGAVEDAYWYQVGPFGRFQLAPAASSTPGYVPRQITAASRASNTMEVWWIGRDNSVQDASYW